MLICELWEFFVYGYTLFPYYGVVIYHFPLLYCSIILFSLCAIWCPLLFDVLLYTCKSYVQIAQGVDGGGVSPLPHAVHLAPARPEDVASHAFRGEWQAEERGEREEVSEKRGMVKGEARKKEMGKRGRRKDEESGRRRRRGKRVNEEKREEREKRREEKEEEESERDQGE